MINIKYLRIKIIYLVFKIKKINDFKFINENTDKSKLGVICFVYKLSNSLRVYIKDNKLDYYACYYNNNTVSYPIISLRNKNLEFCKNHDKTNKILFFLKRFILSLKNE